jgi:hypothetical protein
MFDDAPESTKQLCTFPLKISNVKIKGGVSELDLSPINKSLALIFLFLFEEEF